jgi:hypothetical protein
LFVEIRIRNKTLELYKLLTRSDLKGNYEDAYTIEQLFTLLCLDVIINSKRELDERLKKMKEKKLLELAKEIIRMVETENGMSNYSVYNWTNATLEYMNRNSRKYEDIHKMSTWDLKKEIGEYLNRDEE